MRRVARNIGVSQENAQDLGDITKFGLEVLLSKSVGKALKVGKVAKEAKAVGKVAQNTNPTSKHSKLFSNDNVKPANDQRNLMIQPSQVHQPIAIGDRNKAQPSQPSATQGAANSIEGMQSTDIVYKKNEVPGDFSKKYNLTSK